jgi:metal-dependent hydrolase (beta-lactamase superfamily II)
MRVLIDSSHDIFMRPGQVSGVAHQAPGNPRGRDFRQILHNQWGLSLFLESQRASEQRTIMLDFGYSPDALINNIEVIRVDPSKVEALIVSHGHFDHFGGLQGFLAKYRSALPADLKLYAGGEDNFCRRHIGPQNQLSEWGVLDRLELAAHKVTAVLCETPTVIAGHAFTTGKIQRGSLERVLPNTFVELAMKHGVGCNASHFTPAEMQGKIVPDEHIHEHATCFNIKDRGLVVISSCGHVGIEALGPAGDAVQPLFITIDPDRDTSEKLATYVPLFHPRLIGLTGSPEQIQRVARAYKVYYARSQEGGMTTYLLDHSAFIYLVDASGSYAGFLPPGTSSNRLVEVIRSHLPGIFK